MPRVTLPDGSVKEFEGPVTALQVAEAIGSRLAKAAVGAKIDGELTDLTATIDRDAHVAIVTEKTRDGAHDPDALFLVRHSAAHVMAEAIQRIVPGAQLVYGPPLDTGFYYDIAFPESRPLREGDFEAIEKEMEKIVKEDRAFTRYEMPVGEGLAKLRGEGSKYKIDNAERAIEAMKANGDAGALSWYATGSPGKNWEDLCRGPHVPSTGRIGAVKVMSLASSYWHGDETSDRLTRVYGTAFYSKKDLDEHLNRLEEAKKRDHRVLGKQLQLFHIDEAVGQGLVLWTPRGSIIRKELQDWIGTELRKMGYTDVYCPHIGSLELYKTSGHFPYYKDSQFRPIYDNIGTYLLEEMIDAGKEGDEERFNRIRDAVNDIGDPTTKGIESCSCAKYANEIIPVWSTRQGYLLKPMNCPHHIKIYASQPRSYRDLPVRLSEFGTVYRWEQSGELNGLTRVRSFTVDDAHLFVRPDQVEEEVAGCLKLVKLAFETLGLKDFRVRVGLRDPDSAKYVGEPEVWDKAEAACRAAAASLGAKVSEEPGEAAFYGPKIDFIVKDVIGREWQLGTVQIDYNLPDRFQLEYVDSDNTRKPPVMIHRAPFGSMERFVGVLIEHFAGAFPTWLAPEQVRVLPISEKSLDYAKQISARLVEAGVRSSVDESNERVQAKIKDGSAWKVPYLLVVGPRDEENSTVSVRAFGEDKDLGAMALDAFTEAVRSEIATKGATSVRSSFA